ncbi:signal recognition particle subunit SRP19 [Pancytospora philotis]|nr:signal recognition particle subunit SRP19 [Pancytospora philotis]
MDADHFTIYPVFLDQTKTRAEGRKYPKSLTVASPKYQEIKNALDRLHVAYKAEPAKAHPRCQWVSGRFSVKKAGRKAEQILQIVSSIVEEREKKTASGSKVPNVLNLVARKKKKGGKK